MRLLNCQIENFGKLQNLELYFQDGLNVFLRENGFGKSTLAAFIRVMFYGLSGERKAQDSDNERKKYRPWQGGSFGGSLCFALDDGRCYRITGRSPEFSALPGTAPWDGGCGRRRCTP